MILAAQILALVLPLSGEAADSRDYLVKYGGGKIPLLFISRERCRETIAQSSPQGWRDPGRPLSAEQYRHFRLLAQVVAAKAKKSAPDANFCSVYEDSQLQDRRFFESFAQRSLGRTEMEAFYSPESWAAAAKFGVTEGELSAIGNYTGGYYFDLNASLRGDPAFPLTEEKKLFAEVLDRALERLPVYRGEPLLRYGNLPPAELGKHSVGSIVKYDAYTSTSSDLHYTYRYSAGTNRFLIYVADSGRSLKGLSLSEYESEVLIQRGARFKVLARRKNPCTECNRSPEYGKGFDFVLAEVDANGTVIGRMPSEVERDPQVALRLLP